MRVQLLSTCLALCTAAFGQQASYFDPAQAYNRLLIEKNSGSYRQVSNYRVTGSAFLFGERNRGSIYSPAEKAENILLTYDTYTQNIEFSQSTTGTSFSKEPGSVDSFIIRKNPEAMLEKDISFVYGQVLGSKEKNYFQAVYRGPKASLYKKYSAALGLVTTNIIQSNLRQFDINVDYYYTDSTGKNLEKLKMNPRSIAKEFSHIKDISSIIDADLIVSEREQELTKIFEELNRQ